MFCSLLRTIPRKLLLRNCSVVRRSSTVVKVNINNHLGTFNLKFSASQRRNQIHLSSALSATIERSMDGATEDRIQGPHFDGIFTEPFKQLISIFERHNFEIRIAGGAVRDLLSGQTPHDIDLATTATPEEMRKMFDLENIRMFNEQGEKHGTVSVRMLDTENYEITTLRIDKVTDGRHAEVEFTRDWRIDSERRDLTVNSMFLGLDGTLFDFFGGREDLVKRRVAFVGTPTQRIQEDYLRILRYFRFYGRLVSDNSQHEPETLKAIADNVGGMAKISGERIWSEWKKILSGNLSGPLTLKMIQVGLGPYIGLPKEPNVEQLERVWNETQERKIELNPVTLLTTLLHNEKDMQALNSRLKFSGFERDLGLFVVANRDALTELKECQDQLVDTKAKPHDCKAWIVEVLKLNNRMDVLEKLSSWQTPRFPVGGQDLKEAGCPPGKMFSLILQTLKTSWKVSNFTLDKETLLKQLPEILNDIDYKQLNSPKRPKLDHKNRSPKAV